LQQKAASKAQIDGIVVKPKRHECRGILELEEGKLRVTLLKAVVKAAQRAKELAFVT
jgi:pyrroline-5-carboxylate reductase